MERQTIIERSAAAIGKPYTKELHDAWVAHVAELERVYSELIRRQKENSIPAIRYRITDRERIAARNKAVRP